MWIREREQGEGADRATPANTTNRQHRRKSMMTELHTTSLSINTISELARQNLSRTPFKMRGFLVRNAFLPSFFATPSALTTQLLRPLSFERRSSFQLQTKKVFDDDVRSADDTKNYSDGESKASSLIDMATSAVETVGNNLDGSLTGEEDEIEIEPEASAEELTEEEIHEATEDETDGSAGIFDITGSLFDSDSPGFWSNIISFVDDDDDDDGNNRNGIFDMFSRDDETDDRVSSNIGVLASFEETSRTWMEMIQSADSDSISSVIAKAQDMKWQEEEDIEKTSLLEIHDAIQQCAAGISAGFDEFFGDEPVPIPTISSLQYYFERTDEIKTPSWKRRMHRFFPKIRVSEMEHINHKLQLARLAYANTVEEIRETLNNEYGCVLLYCDPRAKPNKPAHFVAVKKRQSKWKLTDSLEVYLVVCGTKTVLDIITDLICEAAPYRGGYAHAGMAESGIYLAEKHIDLLKRLRDESGRSRIKVHMLGHSLGAGSAGSKCSRRLLVF